ncbi:hypothetical protein LPB41_12480 [Thalassospira sp. MA62]|nr:hypothetical protein [Thalassospira sp. MA62]
MNPIKYSATFISKAVLAGLTLTFLAGCSGSMIEPPTYSASDVQTFKRPGAPDNVMLIEIHDANNTLPDSTWANALSDLGFAPKLTFIPDATQASPDTKLDPQSRLVVVVNPTQATFGGNMCTQPQSAPLDPQSPQTTVRYGFCVSDKIVSETRAHYDTAAIETQLYETAATVNMQIFPRASLKGRKRRCGGFMPGC